MIGWLIFIAVWALLLGITWFIWSEVKHARRGPKNIPYLGLPGFPISHYNILWHIHQALPNLNGTDYRWEVYTQKFGAKDNVAINMLSLTSGLATKVIVVDVSTRHYNMSWRGLAGCTTGYMREQVQEVILNPVVDAANSAIKKAGIANTEKTNYFIV